MACYNRRSQAGLPKLINPFFALSKLRTWKTSWMILLDLSGDKAISSEVAATTIQNAG